MYTHVSKCKNGKKKKKKRWVLVAHACYPSYRDQDNCGSKPARVNSSEDPISKILNAKKGSWRGSSGRIPG
jgi:hypothetical protein